MQPRSHSADAYKNRQDEEKGPKPFVAIEEYAGGNSESDIRMHGRERDAVDTKTLDDRGHYLAAVANKRSRAAPEKGDK